MTMSHSLRRATARIRCRGVCVKRLVNGSVLDKAPLHQQPSLRAAFEKQSIEQQQDHGADDRHNPAGDIITARKDATDPRANQRAGVAVQYRYDETNGFFLRLL